jgi:spore coat protein JB
MTQTLWETFLRKRFGQIRINNLKGVIGMNEREKLLEQVMAYDFCMIDLGLFLNTHPADTNALKDYRTCYEQSEKVRKLYEEKYGPLSLRHMPNQHCWQWIDSPWPWVKEV